MLRKAGEASPTQLFGSSPKSPHLPDSVDLLESSSLKLHTFDFAMKLHDKLIAVDTEFNGQPASPERPAATSMSEARSPSAILNAYRHFSYGGDGDIYNSPSDGIEAIALKKIPEKKSNEKSSPEITQWVTKWFPLIDEAFNKMQSMAKTPADDKHSKRIAIDIMMIIYQQISIVEKQKLSSTVKPKLQLDITETFLVLLIGNEYMRYVNCDLTYTTGILFIKKTVDIKKLINDCYESLYKDFIKLGGEKNDLQLQFDKMLSLFKNTTLLLQEMETAKKRSKRSPSDLPAI